MSVLEIIRAVFINISENKLKVMLTMLGIIVGTITVVVVLAIGRGSQADVEEQYKNLNVGTLQIVQAFGRNVTERLDYDLARRIEEETPSLKYVSMIISTRAQVSYENISNSLSVIGATEELEDIINLEVEYGRFVTNEDNDDKKKYAVIGMTLAQTYFEDDVEGALGKDITVSGRKYEIIGILEYQGDSAMRELNVDEAVIIPYEVGEKYLTGRMARPSILALASDIELVDEASDDIKSILNDYFDGASDQYMIINAGSRLVSAKASARTITVMMLAVAAIVLIVGGIGIMNVLFVSVKERTREIGILKAIGARRSDILRIFIYEAAFISVIGGIIGVALSLISIPVFNYFAISAILSPIDAAISFAFSVVVGTFFGIYPAAKASALRPIDALNYE